MVNKRALFLKDCLGLHKVDKNYYDALSDAGLPSIGSVFGNLSVPKNVQDAGVGSGVDAAAGANATTNNAFQTYQNFAKTLPQPLSIYNQLETQNGIPQLRSTAGSLIGDVNNLQQTIDRVEPNVNANTGNSLVTNSQREGMVAAQKYPLQQQLTPEMNSLATVESQLGNAEQNVGTVTGLVNEGNQQQLAVAGMGVTVAQDNAARTMTGFTADQQSNMQLLLKKLDIQGTLDTAEWNTLSSLAEGKQQYDAAIKEAQLKNQYVTMSPGQTTVNTFTGKPYTAPTP